MIKIRKIKSQNENDIEKYIKIRKESLINDKDEYNLMTYVEEEENFTVKGYKKYDFLKNYYVIEKNNIFLGYMGFYEEWPNNFQGNHNFTLGPIYISKKSRGEGLGKKLFKFVVNDIKITYTYKKINLHLLVNKNNIGAIKLYEKNNFKKEGEYKDYIQTKKGEYYDVLIMRKQI